jgi:23S rRNA pseudouridine1911/1915/1917 synthase
MKIFYEDNHIIVAYKPKGVLSQADGSNKPDMLTLLKEYIKVKYNKPGNVYLGLVHRLDTNTSGVMVFARTSKAAARLSEAIKNHELKKKYIATVEGIISNKDYIELESYLLKNEIERKSYINKNGQQAILKYRLISNYKINNIDVSDIEIDLKTGRFHQIRCQMSSIGHPLYGDKKYGSKNIVDENSFPLEAYYLSFPHPTTKEILEFKTKENI